MKIEINNMDNLIKENLVQSIDAFHILTYLYICICSSKPPKIIEGIWHHIFIEKNAI